MIKVDKSPISLGSLKSIKFLQYYYFVISLNLIFLLDFKNINLIFIDSFADSLYISKDTGLWSITIFLFLLTLNSRRILSNTANYLDIIYLFSILGFISLVKVEHSVFIPTLLLVSVWYYSAKQDSFPTIFITWTYLLLTLPYPYYTAITPQLQSMAVYVLEGSLGFLGIPVLVQENSFAIPSGQFVVEEGCSGLKYLSVNLILLFLYSILSKFNLRQFFISLPIVIFYSLVINWLRIFIIVITAHNWGFDVPFLVKDHGDLGWVIYAIFLVLFFYTLLQIDKIQFKSLDIVRKLKFCRVTMPSIFLLIPIFAYSVI